MKSFVDLFMDHNRDFESPSSFWKWSSYALIASTLRTNIYHNAGNEILYPNIYVLLLADSGARKGGPFPLITELANELHHTKIYDGRASIQALLEKLSLDLAGKNGRPIRGGSCLMLAEELASFFVSDPQLIPLITNMYRSRKEFKYDLRSNAFTIKDLCFSMLAASNETNLRDVYDSRAVYGGLLGRTFLVKSDGRRPGNDLLEVDITKYDKNILMVALEEIKRLSGQILFTSGAVKMYKSWYKELYDSLATLPDPAGFMSRIHTGILKLAMILAASEYSTTVTEESMETAINSAICLKPNYDTYVMSSGSSSQAKIGSIFLQALWDATNKNGNFLSRRTFLMNYWNQVSAEDFDKLQATLEQAGMITSRNTNNDGVGYQMTAKCRKILEGDPKAKVKKNP